MKTIVWIAAIGSAVVLQSTLLPMLSFKGIRPDLLLIMVVASSLLSGKEQGVGIGFFCGLMQDLASGGIFGLNTLSKMTIGYFFGLAESKVFKEHIVLPVLAAILATGFQILAMFLILFILGYKVDVLEALQNNLFPSMLYNMIVSIPLHKMVYRITKIS